MGEDGGEGALEFGGEQGPRLEEDGTRISAKDCAFLDRVVLMMLVKVLTNSMMPQVDEASPWAAMSDQTASAASRIFSSEMCGMSALLKMKPVMVLSSLASCSVSGPLGMRLQRLIILFVKKNQ